MIKKLNNKLLLSGLAVLAAFALGGAVVALSPQSQQASASHLCREHTYSYSTTYRSCVRNIQGLLNRISWRETINGDSVRIYAGYPDTKYLAVDGYFGSRTLRAVKRFQDRVNITVDGVVGSQTWGKLCNPPSPEVVQVNTSLPSYKSGACY